MATPIDTHCEALAAWADGERVERADVLAALATPEGRAYVVDVMALRQMVALTTPHDVALAVTPARRWPRVLAAAAAAMVCIAAGYSAARFQGRVTPAPALSNALMPSSSATAPAPTHVIRFESGVDWRETAGGN